MNHGIFFKGLFMYFKKSQRQKERLIYPLVHSQIAKAAAVGQDVARSQKLPLSLTLGQQGPTYLGFLLFLSLGHQQQAGSEMQQPRHKAMPIRDDSIAGIGFTHYVTTQPQESQDFTDKPIFIIIYSNMQILLNPIQVA